MIHYVSLTLIDKTPMGMEHYRISQKKHSVIVNKFLRRIRGQAIRS